MVDHLGINNSVKNTIELDVDRHHSLATLNIESMNVRRMFGIVVLGVVLARCSSRCTRSYDSE